jgi:hypothetical protein
MVPNYRHSSTEEPVPVVVWCKVWRRWIAGIVGLKPVEGMDIRLLCSSCVLLVAAPATDVSLVQRNLTRFVCLTDFGLATSTVRRTRPKLGRWATKKKVKNRINLYCIHIISSRLLPNTYASIRQKNLWKKKKKIIVVCCENNKKCIKRNVPW